MALQMVDDKIVYVVDFDTMPDLPITGTDVERPYADALTEAIRTGVISEPGKYGIHVDFTNFPLTFNWSAFKIKES